MCDYVPETRIKSHNLLLLWDAQSYFREKVKGTDRNVRALDPLNPTLNHHNLLFCRLLLQTLIAGDSAK